MLDVPLNVQERAAAEPSTARKIGVYAGELIRAAAQLSVSGEEKHVVVRESLKASVFGSQTEKALENFIAELLPLDGWKGMLLRAALKAVPLSKIVDKALDMVIRATYRGMKSSGIAL